MESLYSMAQKIAARGVVRNINYVYKPVTQYYHTSGNYSYFANYYDYALEKPVVRPENCVVLWGNGGIGPRLNWINTNTSAEGYAEFSEWHIIDDGTVLRAVIPEQTPTYDYVRTSVNYTNYSNIYAPSLQLIEFY